eukprot:6475859-Amphidinium_carterae.1
MKEGRDADHHQQNQEQDYEQSCPKRPALVGVSGRASLDMLRLRHLLLGAWDHNWLRFGGSGAPPVL